jgi:hypothetical protein
VRDDRTKPRHAPATFPKKAEPWRNLGDSPCVDQGVIAALKAECELPNICTKNEFDLIMLHQRRAGTISISVTKRERVGRSISG